MLRTFPIIKEDGKPPQWRPISYPVLKDIKKAITDHGLNSPYTISLLDSFFNSFDLIPNDIRQVATAWLPTLQYAAFEVEWKSLIKNYVKEGGDIRGMTHEQAIDRLYGEGAYTSNARQAMTHITLIHKTSELAFKAIKKVAKVSTTTPSYALIFQGPKEPFFDFATRLKEAIVKQISDVTSQDILFKSLVVEKANEECQKILRPLKNPTLLEMIEACLNVGSTKEDLRDNAAGTGSDINTCVSVNLTNSRTGSREGHHQDRQLDNNTHGCPAINDGQHLFTSGNHLNQRTT
ncbi:hypothetical protein BTVI_55178 [Pitangus sulphuratus]|nr:hypothetical protein BTVI_55178 [Pitangus sulphuratus]